MKRIIRYFRARKFDIDLGDEIQAHVVLPLAQRLNKQLRTIKGLVF